MQRNNKKSASIELPPGGCHLVADNWCHTLNKKINVNFQWTIHNFYLKQNLQFTQSYTSTPFSSDENPDVKWSLKLENKNKTVTVYLQPIYNYPQHSGLQSEIQVQFAIVNKKLVKINQKDQFFPKFRNFPLSLVQFSEKTLSETDDLVFDDGSITIFCEIEYFLDKTVSGMSAGVKVESYDEIVSRIGWLFDNMKDGDVTLNVQGRKFQAHKSILAAKSPVFEAMFLHDTAEKKSNHVDVPDIEPDVFHEVLRFVYTGRVKKLEESATGLLAAADKYLLDNLKHLCANHLKTKRMSAENCIDLLLLDDHHPAKELKKNAVDMFRRDAAGVMATETWKKIKAEQPGKVLSILEMVFLNPVSASVPKITD